MATDIQICNMALARVKSTHFITTLAETGASKQESDLCALFYPMCRDAVLEVADWDFASRREVLTVYGEEGETPASPTNWAFSYLAPSDYIKAREILLPGSRKPPPGMMVPFEIGTEVVTSASTKMVYTDLEEAELRYTAQITETSMFTPLFVSALAWNLAIELNMALAKGQPDATLRQTYQLEISNAVASNYGARRDDLPNDSEFATSFS